VKFVFTLQFSQNFRMGFLRNIDKVIRVKTELRSGQLCFRKILFDEKNASGSLAAEIFEEMSPMILFSFI